MSDTNIELASKTNSLVVADVGSLQAPVLDGDALRRITTILEASTADNTAKAYSRALRYWKEWAWLRYGEELRLPVKVGVVMQFLTDHMVTLAGDDETTGMPETVWNQLLAAGLRKDPFWSASTLRVHIAALGWWHVQQGELNSSDFDIPTEDGAVLTLMKRLRRIRRKKKAKQASAATITILDKMLETCDAELQQTDCGDARKDRVRRLTALRDKALLLFGWASGGRRRSEIAGAVYENLLRDEDDDSGDFGYVLGVTKTDQVGADTHAVPVRGEAAVALREWLEAAQIKNGPLFRRLTNGIVGDSLSSGYVAEIVKSRVKKAGLKGKPGSEERWSGHSLRAGFITEANSDNNPEADTMAMTKHKGRGMLDRYHRPDGWKKLQGGMLADRKLKANRARKGGKT